MTEDEYRRANPEKLENFVSSAFQKVGVNRADAAVAASILVEADLRGIDSHGVVNLPGYYIDDIMQGTTNPKPNFVVTRGSPTTASVDGDGGLGLLVSHRSMSEAIEMAEEYGSGWVTAFNSTHSGAGAYYVLMAVKRNMIGFHFSTGGPSVTGPGGTSRFIGANVIAFAAPCGRHGPFVMDMTPTMGISNKVHKLQWEGKQMPEGWAVDKEGRPITDPNVYFTQKGALLPLGSMPSLGVHKGFGLLLLSDILTGMLSGQGGSMLRRKGWHSQAFGALRIDAFSTAGDFAELMDAMVEKIHSAPTAKGAERMRYPGERGNRIREERGKRGIPLHPKIVSDLQEMCVKLDLPMDIW